MAEPHDTDSVEMPQPTVAPLVMSVGVAMFGMGIFIGTPFMIVGSVVLFYGLGMWVSQWLPGQGHVHEALAPPELRPRPVQAAPGTVQELRPGMVGYRVRLPEKLHPISAGIKGGLAGGVILPITAMLWGLFSGHGIWFPINLLAGMAMPGIEQMTDVELEQFHLSLLLVAVALHVVTSVILGLVYGVLLPTLPEVPQAMAWGALLAPIAWTGATFMMMAFVNPALHNRVSWPWFIASQFVFGVVMTLVVLEATGLRPLARGIVGGLLGGALMPLPALIWSLGQGYGFWYPANLLAGMVLPGFDDPDPNKLIEKLQQFNASWLAIALVMHLVFSVGFGVACSLLLPKLKPIPSPFAWGAMLLPMLWTGASFSLMGVLNPVLQQKVDWPWFILCQFAFGMAAAVVVMRTEQIAVPPAGTGTPGGASS